MDAKWHWLLVDSLARGTGWFKPESKDIADRIHSILDKVQVAYDNKDIATANSLLKEAHELSAVDRFDTQTKLHIMRTPRFDISTSFIKSEFPSSEEGYLKSLPSLTIPFTEFWMEWRYTEEKDKCYRLSTRVRQQSVGEDGRFKVQLDTFILPADEPGKYAETICLLLPSVLIVDSNFKVVALQGEDNIKLLVLPCIHAMALLSCRNVTAEVVTAPRQIRRSTERTDGVALCSYNIIQINNNKRYKGREGESSVHSMKALSICRGHFKTYDEHGLFGSKKGTWWWQDHVRGDYENGVRVKDYVVNRPKEINIDRSMMKSVSM